VLRNTDIHLFVIFSPTEICHLRLRCVRSDLTFWMRLKLHQLGLHIRRNKINIENNGGFGATCWGSLLKLCVKIKRNRIKNINIKITAFSPLMWHNWELFICYNTRIIQTLSIENGLNYMSRSRHSDSLTLPLHTGGSRGANLGHKIPHLALYLCGFSLLALPDTRVLVDKLHY
jgi:hypothetical protein